MFWSEITLWQYGLDRIYEPFIISSSLPQTTFYFCLFVHLHMFSNLSLFPFRVFFSLSLLNFRVDEKVRRHIGTRIVVLWKQAWKHVKWLHGFWEKKIPNLKIAKTYRFFNLKKKLNCKLPFNVHVYHINTPTYFPMQLEKTIKTTKK